ncbi:MAG: glycosyltransferase, partial [Ardenticatenia bacterium]
APHSDISGYRCVVQHGVQGELVPPGDEEALAETLVRLLHDPATCKRYGAAGRETSRRYDWRVVTEEVESFYTELLTAHCLSSS